MDEHVRERDITAFLGIDICYVNLKYSFNVSMKIHF